MSIELIRTLGVGQGRSFVPPAEDYDLVTDTWAETEYRVHEDDRLVVAAWQGEPGSVQILSWPYDEICVIQSGRVALEDLDGNSREFSAGDAFLVPAGFSGWWHTCEPAQKIFVAVSRPHDA